MKKAKEKLTAMLNAMTFAEAGEHETAMQFMSSGESGDFEASRRSEAYDGAVNSGRAGVGLVDRLEREMAAITFAEDGDALSALGLTGGGAALKTVMLIVEGPEIEPDVFSHALNLCRRLPARLEIAAFTRHAAAGVAKPETVRARMEELRLECAAKGIPCSVDVFPGLSKTALLNHIRKGRRIAALVDGTTRKGSSGGREFQVGSFLESVARRLSVPVVKVVGKPALQD
jgi:nucleotide-binding universal stress UspA family protein